MSWQPEPRPTWVDLVNRGKVLPLQIEAQRPLDRASLTGEAAVQLGVAVDLIEANLHPVCEPLDLILSQLESAAGLTVLGRWFTRRFLLRLIMGRYRMAQYQLHDPGVADEVIDTPIIVAGAPRTGTTFLHNLLALDPALRAPEGWELLHPAPPPRPETHGSDPRIELADAELSMPQLVNSKMLTIHRYSGRMYKECLSAMSFAFRSEEFISRYDVPDYVGWLQSCDMTDAYTMHKQVLQILQREMPGRRWVLKSPVHLNNLQTLLQVYPDAKLIITHRDPVTVLASVTSLLATLRFAQSDQVDVAAIGRYHADLYSRSLDGLVDLTERGVLHEGRVVHLRYDDLVTAPLEVIERTYGRLDLPLSPEFRHAVMAEVDGSTRAGVVPHTYDFDDLGIDADLIRSALHRYENWLGTVL